MPVKLIGTLCVAVVAAFFTGYNLDHRCDVWLFHTFENVPVAVTILVSLLSGVIITLPFTFGKREHIKTDCRKGSPQGKKDRGFCSCRSSRNRDCTCHFVRGRAK